MKEGDEFHTWFFRWQEIWFRNGADLRTLSLWASVTDHLWSVFCVNWTLAAWAAIYGRE